MISISALTEVWREVQNKKINQKHFYQILIIIFCLSFLHLQEKSTYFLYVGSDPNPDLGAETCKDIILCQMIVQQLNVLPSSSPVYRCTPP